MRQNLGNLSPEAEKAALDGSSSLHHLDIYLLDETDGQLVLPFWLERMFLIGNTLMILLWFDQL